MDDVINPRKNLIGRSIEDILRSDEEDADSHDYDERMCGIGPLPHEA
jgi:hypothetical protein